MLSQLLQEGSLFVAFRRCLSVMMLLWFLNAGRSAISAANQSPGGVKSFAVMVFLCVAYVGMIITALFGITGSPMSATQVTIAGIGLLPVLLVTLANVLLLGILVYAPNAQQNPGYVIKSYHTLVLTYLRLVVLLSFGWYILFAGGDESISTAIFASGIVMGILITDLLPIGRLVVMKRDIIDYLSMAAVVLSFIFFVSGATIFSRNVGITLASITLAREIYYPLKSFWFCRKTPEIGSMMLFLFLIRFFMALLAWLMVLVHFA